MSTNHAKCALIMPEPYQGQLQAPGGRSLSIIEWATFYDLPPLLVRCGDWAISREGIHCLVTRYDIAKDRFGEPDWVEHVSEKTWVNAADFAHVLDLAKDMVELEMI